MKVLSILISILLSCNLMASSMGENRFAALVDDLQYQLTVEWDQKDKDAFGAIQADFRQKIDKLVQEGGINKAELLSYMKTHVKSQKLFENLEIRLQLMPEKPSSDEVYALFEEMKSTIYSQGASWAGEVAFLSGWVIVATIFIIWSVIEWNNTCAKKGGQEVTTEENCGVRSVCVKFGEDYCHEYQEVYKCDEVTRCSM